MKRQRGLGLVFQRGLVWHIQYSVRGVRHRESSESTNRADAVRLLKQRISEVRAGKPVGTQVERTTLDDLTTMLADDYRANRRHSNIKRSVAHLHEFFGKDARAIDITSDRITAYRAHRQEQTRNGKPVASATINLELALLRRAFRLALDAGKVAASPKFSMLAVDNARKGFFERDQFEAVLDQLPGYLKPVAKAAYLTGWRKSELLSRQWRHVDFKHGWLRLDPGETKNKEGRMAPLTPELRATLEAQQVRVSGIEKAVGQIIPWVFVRDDGAPIHGFRRAWRTACKNAGVSGRLFHDARRTVVRNLERAGVSRSAAMKMTGHKTETVYRRYAIVSESDLREAGDKLAALHEIDRGGERKVVPLAERQ
jgi:integrase